MLQLRGIGKTYRAGALKVEALKDVQLSFREGEFVAVLGPSGCGKTTLLNIIGGLDRYDSGELIVNGRSTKNFSDREMDAYRNHSVGFVFQSYNLISHQSVLANVELALTLSGVSRRERRRRATQALEQVGLSDQLSKRPSQLSGGQMQRVAIARALVNQPDVLLADEPTGALDSATSLQVMELLKDLAKDRLVIMVSHNKELAQRFATRIIELKDGRVQSDSRPVEAPQQPPSKAAPKKTSMGFGTALSLSFQNLRTKIGRTMITAFAGSIGIIGIALILSLSSGVNQYILNVQKRTMSSYPITIQEETVQVGSMMNAMQQPAAKEAAHDLDAVYLNTAAMFHRSQMQATITQNNLTAFKAYLEQKDNPIRQQVSDIRYGYDASFSVYSFDKAGQMRGFSGSGSFGGFGQALSSMMPFDTSSLTEITPSSNDGLVGEPFKEKYSLLAGNWPTSANQLLLVVNQNNELSDSLLYQLGLLTDAQLAELEQRKGAENKPKSWKYEELLGLKLRLLAGSDAYVKGRDGLYQNLAQDADALAVVVKQAPLLTISGIIREKAANSQRQGGLYYPRALTDLVILRAAQSPVVQAQLQDESTSVLTGLRFAPKDDQEKAEDFTQFYQSLPLEQKTELMKKAQRLFPEVFQPQSSPEGEEKMPGLSLPTGLDMQQITELMRKFGGGKEGQMPQVPEGGMELLQQWAQMSGITLESTGLGQTNQEVQRFEASLNALDAGTKARLYEQLAAPQLASLEATYGELGRVNLNTPTSITLYLDTFEQKESIAKLIEQYNQQADEKDQISYTDFVALMISGVTSIVNVISYVLIAFVAVSLVVSSIMIGIITYISVLERTKEIGILRAVGASKKDVARVFTAEAFIIGLGAGLLGIALSALLIIPINQIILVLSKDADIKAILPPVGALILVGISALLSLLAGWLPSRVAAKKDPVECLRAE